MFINYTTNALYNRLYLISTQGIYEILVTMSSF
jgi:hypothetical protein